MSRVGESGGVISSISSDLKFSLLTACSLDRLMWGVGGRDLSPWMSGARCLFLTLPLLFLGGPPGEQ